MKILNKKTGGFTLIELLVVIAIIGLLAAIVLVSLAGARDRARDTRIIASMDQIRSAAEIHLSSEGSYGGLCELDNVETLIEDIETHTDEDVTCFAPAGSNDYCVSIELNDGRTWCVDGTLYAGVGTLCAEGNLFCR